MRKRTAAVAALIVVLAGASCGDGGTKAPGGMAAAGSAAGSAAIGIDELARLDLLPRFKRSVKIGMVSSYDRSGGNDDGFSGKYSFLRKEPVGLVIADLKGPGAVYRIHTPTPTDDIVEFYFDGEAEARLRLKVNQLFDGTRPPFLAPLAGSALGGSTSYVPLTYRTSCKIVIKAETFRFYDINYAEFPDGVEVETYTDPPSADFLARVERAGAILRRAGTDISDVVAPEGSADRRMTTRVRASLGAGATAVLYKTSKPGRILGIRLRPAAALAGTERDILMRAYWDGAAEPAVDAPVGDLFGASFGEPAARSLMVGTSEEGWDYIYFPMPFARGARIELVSEGKRAVEVEAEVVTAPVGKGGDEGRFYAWWRREDPCTEGRPYTYLKTKGRGHVVGMILQAQGLEPGSTGFFEGDDRVVVDGELAVPGTGSEDSLNGGCYDVPGRWERRMSLPMSGCLDYKKPMGRTGGYRLMLTDSYAFRESIEYTIEHGPEGNAWPADYASVVFFYAQEPPAAGERGAATGATAKEDRRVRVPERIVFIPGWNVPIRTTSLQNAVWTKASVAVGAERVRVFSMKTSGEDVFGPHHVSWMFDLPEAGRYEVSIKAVTGPDQGIVRIFERDKPAGEAVNLFAAERKMAGPLRLGAFEMAGGENIVALHLVGADPRAKGMGFEIAEIIFEKVK